MIASILALLLAAAEAPPVSTPAGPTPPAVVEAQAPLSPLQAARDNTERLEQLFEQSCGVRAYAAYDDICSPLADEVHRNRVALDRLEREAMRHPRPSATPATSIQAPAALSPH